MRDTSFRLRMCMCSSVQFLLSADGCRETDFSSMQCIVYGASPITEAILIDAMQTFGCEFVQGFGLTETTGSISVLEHCDHDPTGPRAHLLRSCGRPISTHDIKILDLVTGAEMPEGDVGEICVKGRQVMKGYWRCGISQRRVSLYPRSREGHDYQRRRKYIPC
jgi:fatty-acyl-CoA synthase